jgi:hypothetical protein
MAEIFKKVGLVIEGEDEFIDESESDLKKPSVLKDLLDGDVDGDDGISVGVYELVRVYDISSKPSATLRTTVQKKK